MKETSPAHPAQTMPAPAPSASGTPCDKADFQPLPQGLPFRFGCHKAIPCFTACCAKLRLLLTPYDILRLKGHLGLRSDAFLETYTETFIDPHVRFPLVKLRMEAGEGGRCPFVTGDGCTVYPNRPSACRLYPVGRASRALGGKTAAREHFFLVKEPHCLGFHEQKEWTMEEWVSHEGLGAYTGMNDEWLQIVGSPKSLGGTGAVERKHQMFFMASYNLDRFRTFVFESRFFDLFELDAGLKEGIGTDDEALLRFAYSWLRFSLFGEATMRPKR